MSICASDLIDSQPFNSRRCQMALIDFILSKARRFYLSMGDPSGGKGLKGRIMAAVLNCWQLCDDDKNDNTMKEKKSHSNL